MRGNKKKYKKKRGGCFFHGLNLQQDKNLLQKLKAMGFI